MSAEEILTVIAQLQSDVRVATLERNRAAESRRRGGSTSWETVAERRRDESLAIAARDRWLNAIAAHQLGWAHLEDECPICRQRKAAPDA